VREFSTRADADLAIRNGNFRVWLIDLSFKQTAAALFSDAARTIAVVLEDLSFRAIATAGGAFQAIFRLAASRITRPTFMVDQIVGATSIRLENLFD